ncbi:MAG: S-adenosyl-l-methionine hydroxide adenosyltransferase family protein [Rhodothalassiaceae bacterium]
MTIALFTDFGWQGPYVGQLKARIATLAPDATVIDLMHDAPPFDPRAASYLLAALLSFLPADAIVCAIVDPGVGGPRPPVVARLDGRILVGPGNGLFEIARRGAADAELLEITDIPANLSATFHGRDLFAPVAATLATGGKVRTRPASEPLPGADWPDTLAEVIYIDGYGNAITGLDGTTLGSEPLLVGGRRLRRVRTFCDCLPGEPFWYVNAIGLVEIAVNRGHAASLLDLDIGSQVARA